MPRLLFFFTSLLKARPNEDASARATRRDLPKDPCAVEETTESETERERERKRENARVENDDRETVKEGRRERGKEKAWKNGDALCRREEGKRERKRGGKDREEKTEATTPRYVRPRSLILNYPDTCAEEMTVRVIGDVLLQRPCIVSMYVPRFFLSSPIFSFLLLSLLSPLLSSYHPNLLSSRLSLPLF